MPYQNVLNYKPPFRGYSDDITEYGMERTYYHGNDLANGQDRCDEYLKEAIEKEDYIKLAKIVEQIKKDYNGALFWALGKWRRHCYMTDAEMAAEDHQKFVEEQQHRAEYDKSYDDLYISALKSLGIYKEGMTLEKRPWKKKVPDRPMQWQIDQWERGRLRRENAEKKREEAAKKKTKC